MENSIQKTMIEMSSQDASSIATKMKNVYKFDDIKLELFINNALNIINECPDISKQLFISSLEKEKTYSLLEEFYNIKMMSISHNKFSEAYDFLKQSMFFDGLEQLYTYIRNDMIGLTNEEFIFAWSIAVGSGALSDCVNNFKNLEIKGQKDVI